MGEVLVYTGGHKQAIVIGPVIDIVGTGSDTEYYSIQEAVYSDQTMFRKATFKDYEEWLRK